MSLASDRPADKGVFISYAHEDRPTASELGEALVARGFRVWIDEGELRAGDSIIERVAAAVYNLDFVVAVISPASAESHWCRKELSLAVTGGLNSGRVTVLPVRIGSVEVPLLIRDVLVRRLEPGHVEALADQLADDMESHLLDRYSTTPTLWRSPTNRPPLAQRSARRWGTWLPSTPMPELDDLKTEPSQRLPKLPTPFAGDWPEGIHWHPYTPSPRETLDPARESWLRQYLAELRSGLWGEVLDIWFDTPAFHDAGDRPWEPCAITLRYERFLIVSEDFSANPRRLRQHADEANYAAAHEVVHSLRPWHVH